MKSQYGSPSQAAAPALEYVGVGRRLLALIIDGIILLIVGWIIAVVFPSSGVITTGGDAWDRFKHMGPGAVLQIIIPFVYYIVMEAMQGATVGKMALGIRVVKLDGSPMSWGESIVRNLLRIVDHLPYAIPYLLGAVLIWTSPTKQRGIASHTRWWSAAAEDTTKLKKGGSNHNRLGSYSEDCPALTWSIESVS